MRTFKLLWTTFATLSWVGYSFHFSKMNINVKGKFTVENSCGRRIKTTLSSTVPVPGFVHIDKDEVINVQQFEIKERDDIRNIAIIAHVDHGKTTLVDALLQQSNVFRENEEIGERVMDSNDQERERGITILAKNCAITYKGIKINLVDTPGHADFGGEVERIMNMVDAVLLVVDSVEGPRPQTRFVLKKALELNKIAMVVVNKIDRPAARPEYVVDKTFDLFCELNANDEQTDFPICYASAINKIAGDSPSAMAENMMPLLEKILNLPKPKVKIGAPTQLLVANIDYDQFKGKLAIGRLLAGGIKAGQTIGFMKPGEPVKTFRVTELFTFDNLGRKNAEYAEAGEIVMIAGSPEIGIGDTVVDPAKPLPLTPLAVEEPTVKMTFGVNKSPLGGREGKWLTSRMIRDRLEKELEKNVAMRMKDTDSADIFEVSGRGQLHLTVLIETMRREGFELLIGPPTVITKKMDGKLHEPFESVDVTCPDEYVGACVDLLSKRKGEMLGMNAGTDGQTTINYVVPTRGMIGLRSSMLTATRGTAVMDTVFHSYKPFAGDIEQREKGSLLAHEQGTATTNGLLLAQNRGNLFLSPKDECYEGMIVGVHQRPGDLSVNVCKLKQLTNMRAANKEITTGLVPPLELTLDQAVEYIQNDELVEVTPTKVRMLKNPDLNKKAPQRGK